jgi:hypothetical protein
LLATIPGISTIRASVIASAICAPERFASRHELWSYAMLVSHAQMSDGVSYGTLPTMVVFKDSKEAARAMGTRSQASVRTLLAAFGT